MFVTVGKTTICRFSGTNYASLRETDHAANQVVSEGANLAFASTAYEIVSMHV